MIFKPWIIYLMGVSLLVGLLSYIYWKGGNDKEAKIIKKDLETTIEQQEIINEIRNNRPNDIELINSLRSGTF